MEQAPIHPSLKEVILLEGIRKLNGRKRSFVVRLLNISWAAAVIAALSITPLGFWPKLVWMLIVILSGAAVIGCLFLSNPPIIPRKPRTPPRVIKLSWFARRAIKRRLPKLANMSAAFELKKDVAAALLPIERRTKNKNGKDGGRQLLWLPLFLLISVLIIDLMAANASASHPENSSDALATVLTVATLIIGSWTYARWARWFFWRAILLRGNDDQRAQIVIIDWPFLIPSGTAEPFYLSIIEKASVTTAYDKKGLNRLRSWAVGLLKLGYIKADGQIQDDDALHWLGPFRHAEHYRDLLMDEVQIAHDDAERHMTIIRQEAQAEYERRNTKGSSD